MPEGTEGTEQCTTRRHEDTEDTEDTGKSTTRRHEDTEDIKVMGKAFGWGGPLRT
jgi:hypothetical protein